MVMYTLPYLKWITNKDLLYSTWNSAQCHVAAWTGGGFGGECTHVNYRKYPPLSISSAGQFACFMSDVFTKIQIRQV